MNRYCRRLLRDYRKIGRWWKGPPGTHLEKLDIECDWRPRLDPGATFDLMMGEVRKGNWDSAKAHAANLREWIDKGGFVPDRPHFGDWLITVIVHL